MPALAVLRRPRLLTTEVLAGMVTTLALIPEVISFSIISGVGPDVALISSVVLAVVMSFLGGRPAMVSAAAGSVALVLAPMVQAHGVGYVLPTVLLTGLIQIAFGAAGLARLVRYIPRSVMIGFVNALGVLIFVAQVAHVLVEKVGRRHELVDRLLVGGESLGVDDARPVAVAPGSRHGGPGRAGSCRGSSPATSSP